MQPASDCSVADWIILLPADLWVDILSRLSRLSTAGFSPLRVKECLERQKHHQQLRLVCRRFRDMLQQDQQLSRHLVLSRNIDSESLPSFKLWLNRHGTSVQILVSDSSTPFQKAAVRLLKKHSSALAGVYLSISQGYGSSVTMEQLSLFRTIAVCEIQTEMRVEVGAVQSVKGLHSLTLHGRFTASDLPPDLRELKVTTGFLHTGTNCRCVTSLRTLTLAHAQLSLHDQGLPACTRLEAVHCWFGSISGGFSGYAHAFSTSSSCINFLSGDKLSKLKCVRDLSLKFEHGISSRFTLDLHPVDLNPLFALTSLETLSLHWAARALMPTLQVQSGFTALHRLSQIEFMGIGHGLRLEVVWEEMYVLQSLTVACDLYCDEDMLGLSRLLSLKHLKVADCTAGNSKTSSIMSTLLDNMQVHCVNVEVSLT